MGPFGYTEILVPVIQPQQKHQYQEIGNIVYLKASYTD